MNPQVQGSTKPSYSWDFSGFYRLSSLVPPNQRSFDKSRYPKVRDVIWGSPGAHIVTKCTKSIQVSGKFQVIQIPKLKRRDICPVRALKGLISKDHKDSHPIFQHTQGTLVIAYQVRRVLKETVSTLGWYPEGLGFHALRRSGACWAFDKGIGLDQIKSHGGWKSDAIWRYLISTPKASGKVARMFGQHLT